MASHFPGLHVLGSKTLLAQNRHCVRHTITKPNQTKKIKKQLTLAHKKAEEPTFNGMTGPYFRMKLTGELFARSYVPG